MRRTVWSEEENEYIRDLWPRRSRNVVLHWLPNRSWSAIGRQASYLGLRRSREVDNPERKVDPIFAELRLARQRRGLTRDELADKIGIHKVILARWELGQLNPRWFNFRCWVQALGINLKLE